MKFFFVLTTTFFSSILSYKNSYAQKPYVILISIDGFRHDYTEIHNLEYLKNFKKKIIEDQANRFSNIKIIDEINFDKLTNEVKDLDIIYPSIGENLSFLKSIKNKNITKLCGKPLIAWTINSALKSKTNQTTGL